MRMGMMGDKNVVVVVVVDDDDDDEDEDGSLWGGC